MQNEAHKYDGASELTTCKVISEKSFLPPYKMMSKMTLPSVCTYNEYLLNENILVVWVCQIMPCNQQSKSCRGIPPEK